MSALLAARGVPVVTALPVTTLRWAGARRASFRLTLADGQILKGRRLNTPADVVRVARLSSLLDPRHFPPILAHRGSALLTPWISGQPAASGACPPTRLRMCGHLQAAIHRIQIPPEVAASVEPALDWTVRLDRWLGDLVAGGALDTRAAREIHHLVDLSAPATVVSIGLCHTDFCADNIIVGETGRISVIDNEGISLDAPEFDLARTWYRWPMTPAQARAYADGYGPHDRSFSFAAHFLHWAFLAVLDSAAYRVRVHATSAKVPLDRLADLRRTLGRNEPLPRFLERGGS
jgi:aminoglycoside phosphotransferase (APT) family kinase protein